MELSTNKTLKFSVSGLRGVYGQEITPENIPVFCSAFSTCLPKGVIAVARDSRNTGEAMRHLTLGSLVSCGREVFDLGVLPTPTLKNYIASKSLSGGLMISASHNPPEYNAFKFIKKGGEFFSEKDNKIFLEKLKEVQDWNSYKKQGSVQNMHKESLDAHIEEIRNHIKLPQKVKMKVAIDTLGACATEIAEIFLKKMGIQVFSLYPKLLINFPRQPEPTGKALAKLSSFVVKEKCDIGFAFDPDADRLAIVSSTGKILNEEYTLPLVAMEAFGNRDGDMVVNLSTSWLNQWVTKQFGRKLHRSKVGEAHVVDLMKKVKSTFGGEGNGGIIDMKIPSRGRDSIAGMAWVISLMVRKNKNIEEIIQEMPPVFMKKMKLPLQDKYFLENLKNKITKKFPELRLRTEDGFHFSGETGLPWLHIRTSNTEPVVRIIAETESLRSQKEMFSILQG